MTESLDPKLDNGGAELVGRRSFLKKFGLVGATAITTAVGWRFGPDFAHGAVDHLREDDDRGRTQQLFKEGFKTYWHKLSVVPVLLQIDPTVKAADGIFGEPSDARLPADKITVALRPVAVKQSLLRNVADYGPGTQDRVDRALRDVSPGLLAFWHPSENRLLYLDAEANNGLVMPLNDQGYAEGNGLLTSDVTVEGREARGDRVFPYRRGDPKRIWAPDDYVVDKLAKLKSADPASYQSELYYAEQQTDNYKEVEVHRFYGLSGVVNTSVNLNELATGFYRGDEPFELPPP